MSALANRALVQANDVFQTLQSVIHEDALISYEALCLTQLGGFTLSALLLLESAVKAEGDVRFDLIVRFSFALEVGKQFNDPVKLPQNDPFVNALVKLFNELLDLAVQPLLPKEANMNRFKVSIDEETGASAHQSVLHLIRLLQIEQVD